MATAQIDKEIGLIVLGLIDEMIAEQRQRVLDLARHIRPGLTDQDLSILRSLPDVAGDPAWQFADGQLAGLIAAKFTLRARLLDDLQRRS